MFNLAKAGELTANSLRSARDQEAVESVVRRVRDYRTIAGYDKIWGKRWDVSDALLALGVSAHPRVPTIYVPPFALPRW